MALRQIFDEQYQLSFVPEIETRYRTEYDADGVPYEVAYEWHIFNVNMSARSFTDVISSKLNTEERKQYNLYMQTKGNQQYIGSPFDFNWLYKVTSFYGWRIDPITGDKKYHKGVV